MYENKQHTVDLLLLWAQEEVVCLNRPPGQLRSSELISTSVPAPECPRFPAPRLRQCCSHLHLLTSALEKEEADQDQVDLHLAMGALSLQEEGGGVSAVRGGAIPERFSQEKASTKVREANVLTNIVSPMFSSTLTPPLPSPPLPR